jgi:hypothetical protein
VLGEHDQYVDELNFVFALAGVHVSSSGYLLVIHGLSVELCGA